MTTIRGRIRPKSVNNLENKKPVITKPIPRIVKQSRDSENFDKFDNKIKDQELDLGCVNEKIDICMDEELEDRVNEDVEECMSDGVKSEIFEQVDLVKQHCVEIQDVSTETIISNEDFSSIDLNSFKPVKAKSQARGRRATAKASISIVCGDNGNRLTINQEIIDYLGLSDKVQLGINKKQIILGKNLGPDFEEYQYKSSKTKATIYNKSLICYLVEHFDLDYTNLTSRTFTKVQYTKQNGYPVVVIEMVESQ